MDKHILVVDDEKYVIDLIKIILEKEGNKVSVAYSGEECLKFIQITKPDLIILDLMMPGMDGWEVADRIKGNERTRDIPIVMLTVKEQTLTKEELNKKGIVKYMTKPFDRNTLIKNVKEILGEKIEVKKKEIETPVSDEKDAKSKTDKVKDYFMRNPNKIMTPTEVSKDLGYDLQTVTVILNRLLSSGILTKKERGEYSYESKISPETYTVLYQNLYDVLSKTIGTESLEGHMNKNGIKYDKESPEESARRFMLYFISFLGKNALENAIQNIRSKFSPKDFAVIYDILEKM